MRKFLTSLTLIWVICLGLITSGCPSDSKSKLEAGFAASVRISSYGTDLTKAVTQLRKDEAITKPQFDSIIEKLGLVAQSGRIFHTTLAGFVERYPDGNVPASEFQPLNLLFNKDIYGPVMQVIVLVAGLSSEQQAIIALALAGLKSAVMTIKRLMDKNSAYFEGQGEPKYTASYVPHRRLQYELG